VVELVEFQTILACIYRSPESDFYEFLNKLEAFIVKVYSKGKCLILCGDWNVINIGIKLFNHIPSELKQLDDFKQFRKKLKLFLLTTPLYTLKEYFDSY
jgi:exonuclease III